MLPVRMSDGSLSKAGSLVCPFFEPRGEKNHAKQCEEAPLCQVHAHEIEPHRSRALANFGIEVHCERKGTEDCGDWNRRIVAEVLAELDDPQSVGAW